MFRPYSLYILHYLHSLVICFLFCFCLFFVRLFFVFCLLCFLFWFCLFFSHLFLVSLKYSSGESDSSLLAMQSTLPLVIHRFITTAIFSSYLTSVFLIFIISFPIVIIYSLCILHTFFQAFSFPSTFFLPHVSFSHIHHLIIFSHLHYLFATHSTLPLVIHRSLNTSAILSSFLTSVFLIFIILLSFPIVIVSSLSILHFFQSTFLLHVSFFIFIVSSLSFPIFIVSSLCILNLFQSL